jgi:hypothetical protein
MSHSRADVRQISAGLLADMRDGGVKLVQVVGSKNPDETCEACQAMQGLKIEIEYATPLPLPGCDKECCKCAIVAA